MRRALSRCFIAVAIVAFASAYLTRAEAQGEGPSLELDSTEAGDIVVIAVGLEAADSFEIELAFTASAGQVGSVTPGDGWTLVPQSVAVDKGGTVRASGYSLGAPCAERDSCPLLVLGPTGGLGKADLGIVSAQVLSAGQPLQFTIVDRPPTAIETVAPSPVITPPATPVADDQVAQNTGIERDDGSGTGPIILWFVGIAAALVSLAALIVGGSRWIWSRGHGVTVLGASAASDPTGLAPEELEEFLDRVTEIGGVIGQSAREDSDEID